MSERHYRINRKGRLEPANRIEKDSMGQLRAPSGKRSDPADVRDEDAGIAEAKRKQRELGQQPGETEAEFRNRIDKLNRSQMTGAEIQQVAELKAKWAKEEREAKIRKDQPQPRGEIIKVDKVGNPPRQQVTVEYDSKHPDGPGGAGFVVVNIARQFADDCETRLLTDPTVGMVGILRATLSLRDGITQVWQFVADKDQPEQSSGTDG